MTMFQGMKTCYIDYLRVSLTRRLENKIEFIKDPKDIDEALNENVEYQETRKSGHLMEDMWNQSRAACIHVEQPETSTEVSYNEYSDEDSE